MQDSDEDRAVKWKELSGSDRYRVVEMARAGEVPLKDLCERFGISRQTLYKAMRQADEASAKALEPKKAGRRKPPVEQAMVTQLTHRMEDLQVELAHWKTKYEVAEAFLELQRRFDRGELTGQTAPKPRGKKRRSRRRPGSGKSRSKS